MRPIIYIGQVVASGMIAAKTFANANVLLTMKSDADTVDKLDDRNFLNWGTLTANVPGVGEATL
jgi:hypothetical protein